MRSLKVSTLLVVFLLSVGTAFVGGCNGTSDLKLQNDTQRKRIAELTSELEAARLQLEQIEPRIAGLLARELNA